MGADVSEWRIEHTPADIEERMREYERQTQFFELLINSLPGLFYLFDRDLKIYRWNRNVEAVTGYTTEEIQSRPIYDIFKGDDLKKIQQAIEDAYISGESRVEAALTTTEGVTIPYYWTGTVTDIAGKEFLIGMGIDISKRKQAETSLRESEALYRIFAERMTEGVALLHDLRILFANQAFTAMIGYEDRNQLITKDIMAFVADGFDIYFREMFEAIKSNISTERFFQARWVTRDKNEIWVEGRANLLQWKGQPAILLTARDITDVKRKEISLQKETENLRRENVNLRSSIKDRYRLGDIIGKSDSMQQVYERILNAAASNANVVIYGESGTGKELVAKAVHKMSRRAVKPFVAVNASAIPANLLESEFFGHKKGAFTSAHSDKPGYLDRADGGILFLDEVGDIDIGLQAKLLRALEGGGYSPVGSSVVKHSDFRIISATNKNLQAQIQQSRMREDFFYRIHIIPINLPPLRERKDDIPLLVEHFLRIYTKDSSLRHPPGSVMETLVQYDYPGNVRELQNIIQHYLAVKKLDFLPRCDSKPKTGSAQGTAEPEKLDIQANIDHLEKGLIRRALDKYEGNKSRAAIALGISRKTLARKVKQYQLG